MPGKLGTRLVNWNGFCASRRRDVGNAPLVERVTGDHRIGDAVDRG